MRALPVCLAMILLLAGDLAGEGKANGAFDWGVRLRLRQEYLANVFDFSEASVDDRNYLRVRPQLWGSWAPNERWKLYAMITNEHRHWFKSATGLENRDFEIGEIIFENLYIEAKKLGDTPFGLVLGRQNLFYGEGFVCWDGGPLDGSRTAYFNALILKAEFEKRRIDVHLISDPKRDDYLPVINDQEQSLIEWDETGAGLYYVDKSWPQRTVEAYYFYKKEKDEGGGHPESDVHMLGARALGVVAGGFSFMAEGAVQFGDRGSRSRLAYGGSAEIIYRSLLERIPLTLHAGGIYLSGDDPGTDDFEGWNPLYSRWPKWSELYIYSLARERGPAYWENLSSAWAGVDIRLHDRIAIEGRLHFLLAPQPLWNPALPFLGEGDYRGTLFNLKLGWSVTKYIDGHLLWNAFEPGDYYSGARNTAHFLRWELLLKY